ncbi:MAG: alpha-E domain-containing protein, partial [Polynucleobacter victoriensis]
TLFDSTITYRTRYQRYQDINALMELLVFDNTNPRSMTWILQELDHEIHHLPNTAKEIDTFSQIIQTCQPIFEDTMNIISYTERVSAAGKKLSNEISSHYFAHIKEQRFAS